MAHLHVYCISPVRLPSTSIPSRCPAESHRLQHLATTMREPSPLGTQRFQNSFVTYKKKERKKYPKNIQNERKYQKGLESKCAMRTRSFVKRGGNVPCCNNLLPTPRVHVKELRVHLLLPCRGPLFLRGCGPNKCPVSDTGPAKFVKWVVVNQGPNGSILAQFLNFVPGVRPNKGNTVTFEPEVTMTPKPIGLQSCNMSICQPP
jgi:hypothetical protein